MEHVLLVNALNVEGLCEVLQSVCVPLGINELFAAVALETYGVGTRAFVYVYGVGVVGNGYDVIARYGVAAGGKQVGMTDVFFGEPDVLWICVCCVGSVDRCVC